MGSTYAMGLNEARQEGIANLDQALLIHLRSNHYPPIPHKMIEPAKQAIENANLGLLDKVIELPEPISHIRYGSKVPTHVIIDQLHLEFFLEDDDVSG
jgi:hypothetical protein